MASVLKVSEAASIALHSITLLASDPDRMRPTREIARRINASEAHLSKVLQQLSRAGLVGAVRGPRGGFRLLKNCDEICLLEIFEAIEGPLMVEPCLIGAPICEGEKCILGGLVEEINRQFRDYLSRTTLLEMADVFKTRVEKHKSEK